MHSHPGNVFHLSNIVDEVEIDVDITDARTVCPAGGLIAQRGVSLQLYDGDEEDLYHRHQNQRLEPKGFIHTAPD